MDLASLAIAGVGLLLVLISVPLWREKIKPNTLYGFRTPRTVADPRVWYPANKVLGRDMILAGMAMVLCGLALALSTPAGAPPSAPLLVLSALAPIVAVLHGFYKASVLVAELDGIAPPAAAPTATAPLTEEEEEEGGQRAREQARRKTETQRQP